MALGSPRYRQSGRNPEKIDTARPDGAVPPALVAVSKRQPDERIDAALAADAGCSARTGFRKRSNAGPPGGRSIPT